MISVSYLNVVFDITVYYSIEKYITTYSTIYLCSWCLTVVYNS